MPVEAVKANTTLLDGICAETVEILKDKRVFSKCLCVLKRVTPVRQVEMAQLMCASNTFSEAYAKALLSNTPVEFLTDREKRRRQADPRPEELAQIEHEIESMIPISRRRSRRSANAC